MNPPLEPNSLAFQIARVLRKEDKTRELPFMLEGDNSRFDVPKSNNDVPRPRIGIRGQIRDKLSSLRKFQRNRSQGFLQGFVLGSAVFIGITHWVSSIQDGGRSK